MQKEQSSRLFLVRRKRIKEFSLILIMILFIFLPSFAHPSELREVDNAIREKGLKWVAEETSISKLSSEERKRRLGLFFSLPKVPKKQPSVLFYRLLPSSLDWRNIEGRSYVTSVKDQGNCGSCWAFATIAALESKMLLSRPSQGIEPDLSEQILVSCGGAGNCEGGYIEQAADFIQYVGIPAERCYPYNATNGKCIDTCANWYDYTYKISEWYTVSHTISAIKEALNLYGPLVIGMAVYTDFLYYSSGVYSYAWGSFEGYHAVTVVGYNDTEQYFIVKNTWGTGWGESGYFRIAYSEVTGNSQFGIETFAFDNAIPPSFVMEPSQMDFDRSCFLEEYFDSGIPSNWQVIDYAGTGCIWRNNNPSWPFLDSPYVIVNCKSESKFNTEMRTPSFNAGSCVKVKIDFSNSFRKSLFCQNIADVDVSIDGGTTWITILQMREDDGWLIYNTKSIDISSITAGQSSVIVRFHYYSLDDCFWSGSWAIDDLKIYCASGTLVGSVNGPLTVAVSNTENSEIMINSVSLAGVEASQFAIHTDNCSSRILSPPDSCVVDVVFIPETVGSKKAALVINSFDQDSTSRKIQLSGTGELSTYNQVVLLAPDGGEVIQGGENYIIRWGSPARAKKYKLLYSLDNGITWETIATNIKSRFYGWKVPKQINNKKCFVKVIGYDAFNKVVGKDTSDAPFTIESIVKVISPKGGETFTPGDIYTITWLTNFKNNSVEKVKLSYTLNGGRTWNVIKTKKGNPGFYRWIVPSVGKTKTYCKVKVELLDYLGSVIGTDVSNNYFTIQPIP